MSSSPGVLGNYQLVRRLAVGGMGEIFLATQRGIAGFERTVIIKTLLPDLAGEEGFLRMFLDEARLVATLSHPNIVSILDLGQDNGTYYISMEYIPGLDLARLQKRAQQVGVPLPPRVIATLVADAAAGLDYAHRAVDVQGRPLHVIHRDVSPQNIMVRFDGVVKVVDFGVAKALGKSARTGAGFLKGKMRYMSPEQVLSDPMDARADQFALGVVTWELLTGQAVWGAADGPLEIFAAITTRDIQPPSAIAPGVPGLLDAVVMRMLARRPDERYGSCGEVAANLRAFLTATGGPAEMEVRALLAQLGADKPDEAALAPTPSRVNLPQDPRHPPPASTPSRLCPVCSQPQALRARFCSECGARMPDEAPVVSGPPSPVSGVNPVIADPPPTTTPPQSEEAGGRWRSLAAREMLAGTEAGETPRPVSVPPSLAPPPVSDDGTHAAAVPAPIAAPPVPSPLAGPAVPSPSVPRAGAFAGFDADPVEKTLPSVKMPPPDLSLLAEQAARQAPTSLLPARAPDLQLTDRHLGAVLSMELLGVDDLALYVGVQQVQQVAAELGGAIRRIVEQAMAVAVQVTGNTMVGLFGVGRPLPGDVDKALACAAALQAAVREVNQAHGAAMNARFGLERGVFLSAPGPLAANRLGGPALERSLRLCKAADSGCMLVSVGARALASGRYAFAAHHSFVQGGPEGVIEAVLAEGTRVQAHHGLESLVGRAAELDLLRLAMGSALRGEAAGLFLLGEAGTGKTALLDAVAVEAQTAQMAVIRARARGGSAPHTLGYLRQLVRALPAALAPLTLPPEGASPGAEPFQVLAWAGLDPGLVAVLEALASGALPRPGHAPPSEALAMEVAVVRALRVVAAHHGVCVLLDDPQRADVASLDMLERLLTRVAPARVLLVAAGPPDPSFRHWATLRRVPVRPLSEPDTYAYARARLRSPDPALEPHVRMLVQSAGGLPQLLESHVLGMVARGALEWDAQSFRAGVNPPTVQPASVPAACKAVVAELSETTQYFMAHAAHAGMEFSPSDVNAGIESAGEVQRPVDEAVARGILVQGASADRLAFRHASMREHLAALLSAGEVEMFNQRLAVAWAAAPDIERREAVVAGALPAALDALPSAAAGAVVGWRLVAGQAAAATEACRAIMGAASRRWRAAGAGERPTEARRMMELLHALMVPLAPSDPVLAAQLHGLVLREPAFKPDPVQHARVVLELGQGQLLRGRPPKEVETMLDGVLEALPEDAPVETRAALLAQMAEIMLRLGDAEGTMAQVVQILQMVNGQPLSDTGFYWRNLLLLARAYQKRGIKEQVQPYLAHALNQAVMANSAAGQAEALRAMSAWEEENLNPQQAIQHLVNSAAQAMLAGDVLLASAAHERRARILRGAGQAQRAQLALQEAVQLTADAAHREPAAPAAAAPAARAPGRPGT